VAAHEAGHAIQHKVGYAMMSLRQTLVPAVQIASPMAFLFVGIGIMFAAQFSGLLLLGIAALGVITLFQLVTLPVEFDASRRAKAQLVHLGIVGRDELPGVRETLDAAAWTYVAAFVSSLGNLLYLLLHFAGGRSDD
jgi:Zn-dependent membrane protease YugP